MGARSTSENLRKTKIEGNIGGVIQTTQGLFFYFKGFEYATKVAHAHPYMINLPNSKQRFFDVKNDT